MSFKTIIHLFLLVLISACGKNGIYQQDSSSKKFLGGRITPLGGLISKSNVSWYEAYAAPCTDPVYARLYSLNAAGELDQILATTQVPSSTEFSFDVSSLSLDANVKYIIEVSGCNDVYYRPITDFTRSQDVTYASTLVGYAPKAITGNKLNEISRSQLESLMNSLGGTSILNSYNNLNTQISLSNQFMLLFGSAHTVLTDAQPQILNLQVGQLLNEGILTQFIVNAGHFNPGYNIVYNWKIDGVLKSTSNTYNYTPGANDQGTKTLSLYIGKDDGGGNIDVTKPYYARNFLLTILNTIPATALSMSMASTNTTSRNINVLLNTGIAQANCASFTDLALTEQTTATPASADFTISCNTNVSQTYNYNLVSAGDGVKTLRLWARDAAGNISATPTTLNVTLDTGAPTASIAAIPASIGGGVSRSVTFSASDATGLSSLKIYFTSDDSNYSFVADLTTSPYSWSVPAINTAQGRLRIIAIDNFTNSTTIDSNLFTIDSNPPSAPSVALTSAQYTNSTATTLTVSSCTDRTHILVNEGALPASTDSAWQTCSTTASATLYTLTGATEGTRTLKAWAKDANGNVSTTSGDVTLVYDITNPTLSLSAPTSSSILMGGVSSNVTFSATDTNFGATPITFEYSLDGGSNWTTVSSTLANTSPYAWSVPASTNITNARARVKATDRAGNVTTATSANFIIDSTAPVISSTVINNGAATTNSYYVLFDLNATDTMTNVTHFCIKRNTTSAPNLSDTCWISVTAAPLSLALSTTLAINDYNFLIGFTPGTSTLYSWARDAAGNISTLGSAGAGTAGVDKDSIDYVPPVPPVVTGVESSNTAGAASPPTTAQLLVTSGNDIFVRWKATAASGFGASPITIQYTVDDLNYTTLASNIANAQGAGCTLVGDQTGCYQLSGLAPVSTFFRIRVMATDLNGISSTGTATPMNVPNIKFLVGNTNPGTDNSASSAMFINYLPNNSGADTGSLAVSSTGVVYFRDASRGILKVDPTNGIQRLFIPTTGTSSGDGGPVTSATLRWPYKIAMDHQDRLIIFDYNKIRRVDTSTTPNTITTIIGGGASSADNETALNVQITPPATEGTASNWILLTCLPNGDILFQSNGTYGAVPGVKMRHYHQASGLVDSVAPSGAGHNGDATANFTAAPYLGNPAAWYNPSNSQIGGWLMLYAYYSLSKLNPDGTSTASGPAINPWGRDDLSAFHTGLDGNIYRIHVHPGLHVEISRYDTVANNWTRLVGAAPGNGGGTCSDGTAALSCKINPQDVFVNTQGQLFFTDWGRIRTIDHNGNVQTLMGQTYSFGDGGSSLSARFGRFDQFGLWNDGTNDRIIIPDWYEYRLREGTVNGNIQTIAGDGTNAYANTTTNANAQPVPISNTNWIQVNPTTGNVYMGYAAGKIGILNRGTGRWQDWLGGGATLYSDPGAPGLLGNQISLASYYLYLLGFNSTDMLIINSRWTTNLTDIIASHHDLDDGLMSSFAGQTGINIQYSMCADGTTINNSCVWRSPGSTSTEAVWDSGNTRWLVADSSAGAVWQLNRIRTVPTAPSSTIGTLVILPRDFTSFTYRDTGANQFVYYCAVADGKLYKYNLNTTTETELTYSMSGVTCTGRTLKYSSSRNSLLTVYKKSSLFGVMEYLNP